MASLAYGAAGMSSEGCPCGSGFLHWQQHIMVTSRHLRSLQQVTQVTKRHHNALPV